MISSVDQIKFYRRFCANIGKNGDILKCHFVPIKTENRATKFHWKRLTGSKVMAGGHNVPVHSFGDSQSKKHGRSRVIRF